MAFSLVNFDVKRERKLGKQQAYSGTLSRCYLRRLWLSYEGNFRGLKQNCQKQHCDFNNNNNNKNYNNYNNNINLKKLVQCQLSQVYALT